MSILTERGGRESDTVRVQRSRVIISSIIKKKIMSNTNSCRQCFYIIIIIIIITLHDLYAMYLQLYSLPETIYCSYPCTNITKSNNDR